MDNKQPLFVIIQIFCAPMSDPPYTPNAQRANHIASDRSTQQKKKRRTRKDDDGRNFICTCGKSYLSYPALYTHIKTKHGGKSEYSRHHANPRDEGQGESKEEQEQQQVKTDDQGNMQTFRVYLNKTFPFTHRQNDDKKVVQMSQDASKNYLKDIKQYWEKRRKEDQPHQNQIIASTIDHVFGLFLIQIQRQVSKNAQKYLNSLIVDLRKSLNQMHNNEDYCSRTPAGGLPYLMNELFTQKLQKMGEDHIYSKHPTILCKVLFHFSRWMFCQRFTNSSLKFNSV